MLTTSVGNNLKVGLFDNSLPICFFFNDVWSHSLLISSPRKPAQPLQKQNLCRDRPTIVTTSSCAKSGRWIELAAPVVRFPDSHRPVQIFVKTMSEAARVNQCGAVLARVP